ncbi:hypothetical protein PINS_up023668 [Pythium insidiosum]|nr:hypothetical protein PINS_up023668 [Pythium insidiosum]
MNALATALLCWLCAFQIEARRPASAAAAASASSSPQPTDKTNALRRELDNESIVNATRAPPQLSLAPATTTPPVVSQPATLPPIDRTRGIIVALHDGVAAMGASLIRELRCLGNRELIQVYHCFPEELSAESRTMLTRNVDGVEIIDVCTSILKHEPSADVKVLQSFKSYWVKPLAVYHSSLKEIILLDADVVLLRDPAVVRSLAGYNRTGTTFFYDRVSPINKFLNRVGVRHSGTSIRLLHHLVEKFDYARFGLAGPRPSATLLNSRAYKGDTAHEQDSSMVLIDKRRSGIAMEVLRYLIFHTRFHVRFSWFVHMLLLCCCYCIAEALSSELTRCVVPD